jgi:hypothetical protein
MTALPTRVGEYCLATTTDTCEVCTEGTTDCMYGFHQGPAHAGVGVGMDGNRQGTYLTMMSLPGLKFGIINVIGNFGTVFLDQSYWQSGIAAKPASAHKGFILGGMVWFTIPFSLATALGLAGNALNVALHSSDAGNGLVPPASAIALMGTVGGVLVITQLTMAILSTGSAECIAVSSLWSYDIYRTYINPNASGKQILMQSRIWVAIWALVMALASITLNAMGLGLGWVYCFMGIWIGSGVCPVALCIYSDKLNSFFAQLSAWLGLVCALVVWIAISFSADIPAGQDAIATLNNLDGQTYGGLTALLASGLICLIGSYAAPMGFDWNIMVTGITLVGGDGGENSKVLGDDWESKPEYLEKAKSWIFTYGVGYSVFLCVVWPIMMIPFGAFGKSSFQIWSSVALCWGWSMGLVIVILPVWEARYGLLALCGGGKATSEKGPAPETATA